MRLLYLNCYLLCLISANGHYTIPKIDCFVNYTYSGSSSNLFAPSGIGTTYLCQLENES